MHFISSISYLVPPHQNREVVLGHEENKELLLIITIIVQKLQKLLNDHMRLVKTTLNFAVTRLWQTNSSVTSTLYFFMQPYESIFKGGSSFFFFSALVVR